MNWDRLLELNVVDNTNLILMKRDESEIINKVLR